jgi:hypothetical protein
MARALPGVRAMICAFSLGVSYELAVKPARKLHSKNLPAEIN